jgi:hypothetical protein
VTVTEEVNKLIDFSRERERERDETKDKKYDKQKNNFIIFLGILDKDELGTVKGGLLTLASSEP